MTYPTDPQALADLTITRGLPASGKTTWAEHMVNAASGNVVRVNRDDIRRMLHGKFFGDHDRETQVTVVQFEAIRSLLKRGVKVIVDDTNLRQRTCVDLLRIATLAGASFDVVNFTDVPLEVCVRRDADRTWNACVGETVIQGMYRKYLAGKTLPLPYPVLNDTDPITPVPYVPLTDKPAAIIVDIDGTVALRGTRSPFDETRVHEDEPNKRVIETVRALVIAGYDLIFCSGRTDGCREETERWLRKHIGVPFEELYMRAAGDMRKDSVVKLEIFNQHIRHNWNVLCVFDDRNQVVKMWRLLGLTVLQVAEGDF